MGFLWVAVRGCGTFWNFLGSSGWLWVIVGFFWVLVGRCGWFVGSTRWLWVVVRFLWMKVGSCGFCGIFVGDCGM